MNRPQLINGRDSPLLMLYYAKSAGSILKNKRFRVLFFFFVFSIIIFVFYANYSITLKDTVFAIYTGWNYSFNGLSIASLQINDSANGSAIYLDRVYRVTTAKSVFRTNSVNVSSSLNDSLYCPMIPPNLGTRIPVNLTADELETIEQFLEHQNLTLELGGKWWPKNCVARHRVAIIIPYRDRMTNLKLFLRHMHPFLSKQQLYYGIYLIEPEAGLTFNRGLLMNIGFKEAIKDEPRNGENPWQCFTFHDVDLLPEDERNIYSCPETPRHMSSAVSTLNYVLPYESIFGGVTEFTKDHFQKINGFSNVFFGWGGEDDDLRTRVKQKGLSVSRYPLDIGRYTMAKHTKDKPNPSRFKLLTSSTSRIDKDGISSLKYVVKAISKYRMYTKILVSYNQAEISKDA